MIIIYILAGIGFCTVFSILFLILMVIFNKLTIRKPDKETDDVLTYYTTTCTSCGKVSPIGDYCMWCGEKGTCLEGGDLE